jgi:hypothetical protein
MKTVMVINNNDRLSNRIKQSIQDKDISIITAETNRDALSYFMNGGDVDLFLIPTEPNNPKKGYMVCKSSNSLSTPLEKTNKLVFEESTPNEINAIIKKFI